MLLCGTACMRNGAILDAKARRYFHAKAQSRRKVDSKSRSLPAGREACLFLPLCAELIAIGK